MDRQEYEGLVMDLGVAQGNDTAFYLAKGFRVIAVEADEDACRALRTRFADQVASGAVTILNFAASDTFGQDVHIYVHEVHRGASGFEMRPELTSGYSVQPVTTIDWNTLCAQGGVPRYLKIDIEGGEEHFLRSVAGSMHRPEFVSVECHAIRPIEQLHGLGYRRFRLVDQNPPGGFHLPARQMEGHQIEWDAFDYSSGPFGLDLFGDGIWSDFQTVCAEWQTRQAERGRTWFDCHAWLPG